ncbi:MAG: hypothetical protein AAF762_11050, partial [Pseudomonadota bacterium]
MGVFHHELDLLREVADGLEAYLSAHDDWPEFEATGVATEQLKDSQQFQALLRARDAIEQLSGAAAEALPGLDPTEQLQPAEPPPSPNDLTRIRRITRADAETLNGLGVVAWQQIADWSADDVARADGAFSGVGRPLREVWIEQAAHLVLTTEVPVEPHVAPVAAVVPTPSCNHEPDNKVAPPPAEPIVELSMIKGLSAADAETLAVMGYTTTADVASWTADDVARLRNDPRSNAAVTPFRAAWCEQAALLAAGVPTAFAKHVAQSFDTSVVSPPTDKEWEARLVDAIAPPTRLQDRFGAFLAPIPATEVGDEDAAVEPKDEAQPALADMATTKPEEAVTVASQPVTPSDVPKIVPPPIPTVLHDVETADAEPASLLTKATVPPSRAPLDDRIAELQREVAELRSLSTFAADEPRGREEAEEAPNLTSPPSADIIGFPPYTLQPPLLPEPS